MAIKYLMQLNGDQIKLLSSMYDVQTRNHNWFSIDVEYIGWETLKQRGWSRTKAKKIARSLYGIIGLYTGTRKIVDYFVTPELYPPCTRGFREWGNF